MAKKEPEKKKKLATKTTKKNKVGRKSKHDYWISEEGLEIVRGCAMSGMDNANIAKQIMNICETTFYDWIKKFPQLAKAIKITRSQVDMRVVNSLSNNSIGYYITEQVPMKLKRTYFEDRRRIEEEYVEIVEIKKWIEPNVTAQIFWTKNRLPSDWKEKRIDDISDTTQILSDFIKATNKVASTPEAKVDLE
jgi:hypothetical protein